MNIERRSNDQKIFLHEKGYLGRLIEKFVMNGAKPTKQPLTSQR